MMRSVAFAAFVCVSSAEATSADSHYNQMHRSFFALSSTDQLKMVNRTIGSMRALRQQMANLAEQATEASRELSVGVSRMQGNAQRRLQNKTRALHQHLEHQFVDLKAKTTQRRSQGAGEITQECSWTCGWSMYRDLNALMRYAFGYNCEALMWVDWWFNGVATLMVDQKEPLHRALLELTQMYTTVGYGAPYVPGANAYLLKIWNSLHAVTGSFFLLKQMDRVVDDIILQLVRYAAPGLDAEGRDHADKILGACLLGVEMVVVAYALRGDTTLDSSRNWYTDGWYLAAMTAASVGYGDFTSYSSLGNYFSPIWMSILVSTWNAVTAGQVFRGENDCSFIKQR